MAPHPFLFSRARTSPQPSRLSVAPARLPFPPSRGPTWRRGREVLGGARPSPAPVVRLAAGEAWPVVASPSHAETSLSKSRQGGLRAASSLARASSPNRPLFFPSLCTVPRKKNLMCGYNSEEEVLVATFDPIHFDQLWMRSM
jgi:hypothetical protein